MATKKTPAKKATAKKPVKKAPAKKATAKKAVKTTKATKKPAKKAVARKPRKVAVPAAPPSPVPATTVVVKDGIVTVAPVVD